MKSILKPCPFCGSLEIAIGSDEGTVTRHNTAFGDLTRTVPSARWAYCCTCGCSAPSVKVKNYKGWYDEKEQADAFERAIAAWNRRTEQESELPASSTPTNAQRIRSMSDEELARWLVDATVCERVCHEDEYCHGNECVKRVTDWLRVPAETEGTE